MMNRRVQLGGRTLTMCYTPKLLDFIFLFPCTLCWGTAVVHVAVKVQKQGRFFFSFPFQSPQTQLFSNLCIGFAQTLGRGSMEEQGTLTHPPTQKHRKRLTANWFKAPLLSIFPLVQNFNAPFLFFSPHKGCFSMILCQLLKASPAHWWITINIKTMVTLCPKNCNANTRAFPLFCP